MIQFNSDLRTKMNYLLIFLLLAIPIAASQDDPEPKFQFFTKKPNYEEMPTTEKEVQSKVKVY